MATYDDLSLKVWRKLDDAAQANFDDVLIYDAVVAAHYSILPWVPRMAVAVLSSGSAATNLLTLPTDLYQVQALQDVLTGKFYSRATLAPRTVRNTDYITNYDWIDYPTGYLTMSRDLDAGTDIRLYYLAHWTIPDSESDSTFVITVPSHAHTGMVCYAASYCLESKAANTANIRQWAQRLIDSGTPEDNPFRIQAKALYEDFLSEMRMMPPFTKVTQ